MGPEPAAWPEPDDCPGPEDGAGPKDGGDGTLAAPLTVPGLAAAAVPEALPLTEPPAGRETGPPSADPEPSCGDGGDPNPDEGAAGPNPDDGSAGPNPDDDAAGRNPDGGSACPNPDDGSACPNPDDGAGPNADGLARPVGTADPERENAGDVGEPPGAGGSSSGPPGRLTETGRPPEGPSEATDGVDGVDGGGSGGVEAAKGDDVDGEKTGTAGTTNGDPPPDCGYGGGPYELG
jgi:hypothetical protein